MQTFVALLRGINVGGHNKVPMAELRSLVESLGHSDVRTYIQSGNVVFASATAKPGPDLEHAIQTMFGANIAVMVRSATQLRAIVKANPFSKADLAKVHVGFMATKPTPAAIKKLDAERFLPEEFAFKGTEVYLHLPDGMGRSKLPDYVVSQLKIPATMRNWNTAKTLLDMATA